MNRRLPALITGILALGLALLPTRAEVTGTAIAPAVATSAAPGNPQVTCTSSDALACADALRLATETREQLASILNLGPEWRFAVHIHIITQDDPLASKIDHEASAVFADDTKMRIEAVLPAADPDARAFIQRQYVTALLWEKYFAETKTFDSHTPLNRVPVWLIEGLREWLNEDPDHNRAAIVRRAVQTGHAASLKDISGWTEFSHDKLGALWQRAFSYYIVDSLLQKGPPLDAFQQWLTTLSSPVPPYAETLFPTEDAWQRSLSNAVQKSKDVLYTWDETADAVDAADTLTIAGDKPTDPPTTCQLASIDTLPRTKKVFDALQAKNRDLTALELRAHPSWHPILELYRLAITECLDNSISPEKSRQLILQAMSKRAAEVNYHQKLVDYVNWFEVNNDYSGKISHFQPYFDAAQETDHFEADPQHPNPIRSDLLHVESQL